MTDANNHATTYAYDALNRLVSTTDPLSHVTGYGYDAVGNRTSQTKPDGTTVTYTYDALNRLTGISLSGRQYQLHLRRRRQSHDPDRRERHHDLHLRRPEPADPGRRRPTARSATATICSATAPA